MSRRDTKDEETPAEILFWTSRRNAGPKSAGLISCVSAKPTMINTTDGLSTRNSQSSIESSDEHRFPPLIAQPGSCTPTEVIPVYVARLSILNELYWLERSGAENCPITACK